MWGMGVTRREALAAGAGALLWPSAAQARVRPFAMVGVSWRSPARVRIELRVRSGDGGWSPWGLASAGGHGGDGRSGLFGEPMWVGRADQIQLRGASGVDGVRVHTVPVDGPSVRPSATALPPRPSVRPPVTAVALPLAQPSLPAGPGQPPIIARSAWAGGRARPRAGPFYGSVQLAFVHHTDNPNGYARADVPAMLLAMFDYHRYVRGYYDIAYNFIIDAFGQIWEGRAGGIDEPVLGAHAGGFNGVSTGVAVLGTFMDSVPPPAALDALQQLLAWKLSLHGAPARGEVTVEVNPAEAYYTPFRPGQRVLLPRIAGHRDGDLTDCPGDAFYHRLPALRPRVAALAGPLSQLTISPVTAVVGSGATVTLGGRLLTGGAGVGNAPIAVQAVAGRRTLARVTTDASGRWSASVVTERNLLVRALHALAPAVVSEVVEIGVAPVLTLTLASSFPPRVTGTVTPAKAKVTIDVYRDVLRRTRISSTTVRVHRGRFSFRPKIGAGVYTVIARTAADARTVAGASAPLQIRH
jgi:N-acetylmuramoyl-L-alanine amidase